MPTYLLHGFRWPRPLVRIHIILQNLDDAAAEWLVAPNTSLALLRNFHDLFPSTMRQLDQLRFVEQYDPTDESAGSGSQPYAYVADTVHEIKLGVAVDDVVGGAISNEQWSAMMELRDKLAPEEKVSWYVVVCGEEERWAPPTVSLLQSGIYNGAERASDGDSYTHDRDAPSPPEEQQPQPKGFKKFFSSARLGRKKSRASLPDTKKSKSTTSVNLPGSQPALVSADAPSVPKFPGAAA